MATWGHKPAAAPTLSGVLTPADDEDVDPALLAEVTSAAVVLGELVSKARLAYGSADAVSDDVDTLTEEDARICLILALALLGDPRTTLPAPPPSCVPDAWR